MSKTRGLTIGLVFPQLRKHRLEKFAPVLERCSGKLDLVVFPEGFDTIQPVSGARPEDVPGSSVMFKLREEYFRRAREWSTSIIVGVSVDYGDTSISGGGNDEYALFVSPTGQSAVYHKHSSSLYTAFFDDGWSIERSFPVVEVKDVKVGLSICHDSYISLIPRVIRTKGADVWVNISYQNVQPWKWEAVLQARAAENEMMAVCTLHRNSSRSRQGPPQKEPYAFCPSGKIRLKDLETNAWLDEMPEAKRAGRVFYFDTSDYSALPLSIPETNDMPDGADVISVRQDDTGVLKATPAGDDFPGGEINLQTFLRFPERIWKEMLQASGKVPLFVVRVDSDEEWQRFSARVFAVVRARAIEFSTLFLFLTQRDARPLMAAYRSSNYKDTRVFYPQDFPVRVDRRYLKGLDSTCRISLKDPRAKDNGVYFERVGQLISFLDSVSPQVG